MGSNLIGIGIIRRMLHRTKIPNLIFLGNNHQTAGVLTGGTPHAYAACSQTVHLRAGFADLPFL